MINEEPDGDSWYQSQDPDEQDFIRKTMEQCDRCGEWVTKGKVLKNGICLICRRREEEY